MTISKSTRNKRRAEFVAKQRADMLKQFGYSELKAKHGKSARPEFPNLKTDSKYQLSNAVTNGYVVVTAAQHVDAKQFPVGFNHKQGPMLLTKADDLAYAGGKKT